jgi:hypothetical protein
MIRIGVIGLVLCLLVTTAAVAAEFRDYPEFRYASGLPGGGNGVTPDGHLGFDGALQVNIPVGYTPGWGNFMLTPSTAAINGGFPDGFWGDDVNGSLAFGFGMFHKYNLWYSAVGTGKGDDGLEPVENLQLELVKENKSWPGISVGVVDLRNQRASSLDRPFEGDGRSFYAVATRKGGTEDKPLYYTLGFGTGRFNDRPFGGISYQPAPRVKVYAEYDGWVGNIGGAYDLVKSPEWHGIVGASLIDFSRVDLSFSITKTDF